MFAKKSILITVPRIQRDRLERDIAAARQEVPHALDALVEELSPSMWMAAKSEGATNEVAEKSVQEAWLRLTRYLDQIDNPSVIPRWLIHTASTRAIVRTRIVRMHHISPNGLAELEEHFVSQTLVSRIRTLADCMCQLSSILLGKQQAFRADEWRADLRDTNEPVRYAMGLVVYALKSRARSLGRWCLGRLCWILASEVRTWVPLLILLSGGTYEAAASQGPFTAVLGAASSATALYSAVKLARRRWNIEVAKGQITDESAKD